MIQPQFTLTGALVQLATALANTIRTSRDDVTPSQGEHASTSREHNDESYIPIGSQKEIIRESPQKDSQKRRTFM